MGPEELGYSPEVLAVVAVAGTLLLVFRPRLLLPLAWAAILTVDNTAYTFTRVGSGFFLVNLFDVLLILGLLAGLRLSDSATRIRLLRIPIVLGMLLVVGLSLTFLQRDLIYEDLRLLRFAAFFPVAWAIGALGTRGSSAMRVFLWILVSAVAFQSLRQCIYVIAFADPAATEASWRTLRFFNAGLVYVPIIVLVTADRLPSWQRLSLIVSTALAAVALVLTQTRSLWIPQAVVIAGLLIWRLPRGRIAGPLLLGALAVGAVVLGGRLFSDVTESRVDLWALFTEGHAMDLSDGTGREAAIAAEMAAWQEGNWVLGRGLGFHNGAGYDQGLAWGHNGYTSYLANLGFIGFVAYGLVVPGVVVRWGRVLIRGLEPTGRTLGVLALATVGFCCIQSVFSSGLLAGHVYSMYGLLAGVAVASGQRAKLAAQSRPPRSTVYIPRPEPRPTRAPRLI